MHRAALLLAVAFVGLTLVVAASEEELSAMSKEDLIKALQTTRTELTSTKAHLKHVTHSLDKIYARRKEEEQARKAHEVSEKKAEQKKEEAKRAAKLNKKQKLSDVLMEHGAKFMALKAAKKTPATDPSSRSKLCSWLRRRELAQALLALSRRLPAPRRPRLSRTRAQRPRRRAPPRKASSAKGFPASGSCVNDEAKQRAGAHVEQGLG